MKCDHAGVIDFDAGLATFQIGAEITNDDLVQLGEHIVKVKGYDDKYFLLDFIDFQYGELKESNRVHQSVINIVNKYNLQEILENKDHARPLEGYKDKDKDKEQDKDKDKEQKISKSEIEKLYEIYPRKIGKKKGLEKIKSILKSKPKSYEPIKKAIQNYSSYCALNKIEVQYIKHFSTFVTSWEDWEELENLAELEAKAVDRIDKAKIKVILAQGLQRISEIPPGKLSDAEIDFIREKGGLAQLGRMSNFDLDQVLREVA